MNKLLIICGPTSTGKTDLAIHCAKKYSGEIISADSRQVYKGLDILTGKDINRNSKLKVLNSKLTVHNPKLSVGCRVKNSIPIWLVDVADINYQFNIGEYSKIAQKAIEDIYSRKKLPIIVGGTGMYIQSIVQPYDTQEIPPNVNLRKELDKLDKTKLQEELKNINSKKWNTMNESDKNNPRRLIRAIEVSEYFQTNTQIEAKKKARYEYLKIGLKLDLKQLYIRIDQRVEKRIKQGVIKELEQILKTTHIDVTAFTSTGANVLIDCIQKKISIDEAKQKWKFEEHAYARRQMTWFNKEKDIHWFDISKKDFLSRIEKTIHTWYT
jgi:tRNA dimethylallyltransferase